MTAAVRALVRFLGGFFEIHAPQSMSRLVTLLCVLGALYLARAIVELARRPHLTEAHVDMVKAISVVLGILVIQGAVAIIERPRANVPPPANPPPPGAP